MTKYKLGRCKVGKNISICTFGSVTHEYQTWDTYHTQNTQTLHLQCLHGQLKDVFADIASVMFVCSVCGVVCTQTLQV